MRFLEPGQQRVRRGTGRCVWVTRVVSAHTHADVALGEGNRLGGLWLTAGLEPEFPLWLGLISLPLTVVGDPRWFLPSLGPVHRGEQDHSVEGKVLSPGQTPWGTSMSSNLRCPLDFPALSSTQQ